MVRINFQPYSTQQLEKIVHSRLISAQEGLQKDGRMKEVITPDGIKFAAMKVSSISGDARRVLDICRFVFDYYVRSFYSTSDPELFPTDAQWSWSNLAAAQQKPKM
jgi:hypothetical protein